MTVKSPKNNLVKDGNKMEKGMTFHLTKDRETRAREIIGRYPKKRAAILSVLWLVQEQEGWISDEAMEYVATLLDLTKGDVYDAVSFYTMYNRKPIGAHHIQICNNFCCRLRGADWLVSYIKTKLKCNVGESSADGKFHLSTVECLASCGTAPMMQIDNDYYENLDTSKVDAILEKLKGS